LKVLDDLLISRIRKIIHKTLGEDGWASDKPKVWATRDKEGRWVVACTACMMFWPDDRVDGNSKKLDNLIKDSFYYTYTESLDEGSALEIMIPMSGRLNGHVTEMKASPEELMAFDKYPVKVFEYNKGWSRTVTKVRAYYKAAYLELAKELVVEGEAHFKIYNRGDDDFGDGLDRQWLVVYENKLPVMIIANCLPDKKHAEEDPRTTTG
jgi:hypothetical protein